MNERSVQRRLLLLSVGLASFLSPFTSAAVNLALPRIAIGLETTSTEMGWVQTAFLLAAAMFLLPSARLADMKGRKKIFSLGVFIFTVTSILAMFATSISLLIASRFIQGIGSAFIVGTGVAMLTDLFPPEKRGMVIGVNTTAVYFGLTLGPLVGGVLTQAIGWQSIFLLCVPLGAVILLIFVFLLNREWDASNDGQFDNLGSILYGSMLFLGIYAASSYPSTLSLPLTLGTLLLLGLFLLRERRCEHPLIHFTLFKGRTFSFSNLTALLNYSATFAVTFLLSSFLQYVKGMQPRIVGLILLARPVMMATFSPVAGWISDRLEPRIVSSVGLTLIGSALFLFSFLDPRLPIVMIIANLSLLGFGFAFFTSPNTHAIMSSVTEESYGVASAMAGTMRLIGQSLSMVIALFTFSVTIGVTNPAQAPQALVDASQMAFQIFAVLCGVSLVFSLTRGKIRK